jgi:hypothetical protein
VKRRMGFCLPVKTEDGILRRTEERILCPGKY